MVICIPNSIWDVLLNYNVKFVFCRVNINQNSFIPNKSFSKKMKTFSSRYSKSIVTLPTSDWYLYITIKFNRNHIRLVTWICTRQTLAVTYTGTSITTPVSKMSYVAHATTIWQLLEEILTRLWYLWYVFAMRAVLVMCKSIRYTISIVLVNLRVDSCFWLL